MKMMGNKVTLNSREIEFSEKNFKGLIDNKFEWETFKSNFHDNNKNSRGILFYNSKFDKNLIIRDTVVRSSRDTVIKFIGCDFEENVEINRAGAKYLFFDESCTFKSGVVINFTGEATHDNVVFIGSTFEGDCKIINTENIRNIRLILKGCEFRRLFQAQSVTFDQEFSLDESSFIKYLPDLKNSEFKFGIDLNNIKFKEVDILKNLELNESVTEYRTLQSRKSYDEGIIDLALDLEVTNKSYDLCNVSRTLKNFAASNGDFIREMDFFAIESQARAKQKGGFAETFSGLYKCTSDYGRNISKPLFCLSYLFIIMWTVNYSFAVDWKFWGLESFYSETFTITLKYTLPLALGFGEQALKDAYIIFGTDPKPTFFFNILYIFQSIISTSFWFLFFLSIRNRFKIG